ncbi:MAG: twin-arginine translocation signal domain-containing protein [Burkholderiaceae bacterium]
MYTEKENAPDASNPGVMRIIDKSNKLSRRSFLKGSGLASISVTVLGAGTLLTSSTEAFAQSFTVLSPDAGKVLLVMARDIFPHDKLAEKYYMHAIEPYDAAAAKDPMLKKLLTDGIALLNASSQKMMGKSYTAIPDESRRVAVLKSIESTPFFQKIRGDLVTGLYNNKEVYKLLGYEGSSWEKGGYINRGFNDIDWL